MKNVHFNDLYCGGGNVFISVQEITSVSEYSTRKYMHNHIFTQFN